MDKLPYDQLEDMLASTRSKVTPGSAWQHYKGEQFVVKDVVLLEGNQIAVLYTEAQHPNVLFVRPLGSWTETLEHNGQQVARFTLVN